jgi:hypothetical protein
MYKTKSEPHQVGVEVMREVRDGSIRNSRIASINHFIYIHPKKVVNEFIMTSSSPTRKRFRLFQRSEKKHKPILKSATPASNLSPPEEISINEHDKLSDGKAKPRQLFPNQYKHDPSLKCKIFK